MIYWPKEINDEEIVSPLDIMKEAGEELENRNRRFSVSIRSASLNDRIVHFFEILAKEARDTLCLFEASHQIAQCYPVLINPPVDDTPEFLQRQKFIAGNMGSMMGSSLAEAFRKMPDFGQYVPNEWVCGTPAEFKQKLTQLFAMDIVKSRLVSLLAAHQHAAILNEELDENEDDDSVDNGPAE